MKLSEEKKQVTKIDKNILCLYDILIALDNALVLPGELRKKIFNLSSEIEDTYFPIPSSKNGVEIVDVTYQRNLVYREILD